MRSTLVPVLFDDHDPEAGEQRRSSVVQPAQRSPAPHRNADSKRTADNLPVHSCRSLIGELGTLTANTMRVLDKRRHVHHAERADAAAATLFRDIASVAADVARRRPAQ